MRKDTLRRDIFRIVDANFNRSREGLRVCEDIARFILNSPTLTKELKSIRHKISNIAKSRDARTKALLDSRDVKGDVAKHLGSPSPTKRNGLCDIFYANMERAKESLRVLEEIYKLIDMDMASKFSRLRFKAYAVEKMADKKIKAQVSK